MTDVDPKAYLRSLRSLPAYRLDLRYLGTEFHGWQSQPSGRGLQDHLEKSLAIILRHPVRVIAASRTDTGVHAENQVAIFHTGEVFSEYRWLRGLHALLHPTVGVAKITPVESDFHPIYHSTGKVYRYSFWCGASRHPVIEPIVWRINESFDCDFFLREARSLVGRHDFTTFCAVDSSAKTKERTILEVDLEQHGQLINFWILGHGFLKQMIRIMVGSLVETCVKQDSGAVERMLKARDRRAAGRTAPGQGLSLVEIFYGDLPSLDEIKRRKGLTFTAY